MKRTWAGEVRNVSLPVASAVNSEGYRHLRRRQGGQVRLVGVLRHRPRLERRATDHLGRLPRPSGKRRRLSVRGALAALHGAFYRNVFSHVSKTKVREISHMLKAIHAQESREAAQEKAAMIIEDLRRQKLGKAAELMEAHIDEPLTFYLPRQPLAQDQDQQSAEADHERNPTAHPRRGGIPGRAELPEPGGRPAEAYCRQSVVDAQIYEHGSALRGADLNPRSRRLRKSAKGSGHYRRRFRILAVVDDCRLHEGMPGATGRYVVVRHAGCPRVGQARRRTRPAEDDRQRWQRAHLERHPRLGGSEPRRIVEWHYIAPGKPMQNGFIESFMYRWPRRRKRFKTYRVRRVRSCIRPIHAIVT